MNCDYNIISSGSKGNAVIIKDFLMIDCGVAFRMIVPHYKDLKVVLLTHIHSDHFRESTIKRLAKERPTLRFGCCEWLVKPLLDCGVSPENIDIFQCGNSYNYGLLEVIPVVLVHNVPNCGYKLHFKDDVKVFYATDTNNLNGIQAPNYDLYMVEANHELEEIKERISEKKMNGEYAYEAQAIRNHLSKDKCDAFIYSNIGPNGEYVYMHCHED